jgi:FkbM family methyltransferase
VTIGQLVQRVARTESAQRILRRPRAERVAQVLIQATTVREHTRFVYLELSASFRLARYRLRRSGRPVYLRHNSVDPLVLEEIFYTGHYELPEEPARVLDARHRPPAILDLGANVGFFGAWALDRFPGSKVIAFEPDSANAEVARLTIDANGAGERWKLHEAAATAHDGRVSFAAGEGSRSRIEPEGGTEVEAIDVFPYLEAVDFAKVDIEGGEWEILGDPRFEALAPPVVVLEFHPDQAPGPDPRALALDALHGAGYETKVVYDFSPGQGMVWAWRR